MTGRDSSSPARLSIAVSCRCWWNSGLPPSFSHQWVCSGDAPLPSSGLTCPDDQDRCAEHDAALRARQRPRDGGGGTHRHCHRAGAGRAVRGRQGSHYQACRAILAQSGRAGLGNELRAPIRVVDACGWRIAAVDRQHERRDGQSRIDASPHGLISAATLAPNAATVEPNSSSRRRFASLLTLPWR